ncbi:MAG: metallophosphoesterase, partial [Acidobacteriota bacterium]
ISFQNQDNPWTSLESLVQSEGVQANLLISPGDITTWADPVALEAAWRKLNELGGMINAEVVAAATGNHDVTSRPSELEADNVIRGLNNPTDLFENLKRLSPPYPVVDHAASASGDKAHERRIHYFGADYVVIDDKKDYRLVVVNSCGRHTTIPAEYERGRIAETTLEWLKEYLERIGDQPRKINILLCHHHPVQHEEQRSGSYDFMQGGQLLIDALSEHGDWLVIHGHKHQAKLSYGPGAASAPAVLAAGSFAALPNDASFSLRNQFYLVDVSLDMAGGPLKGTIKAWNWFPGGQGWRESRSPKDGICSGCGFGNRIHPDDFADKISAACASKAPVAWAEVVSAVPEILYVTPKDLGLIGKSLERRHRLSFEKDPEAVIQALARMS